MTNFPQHTDVLILGGEARSALACVRSLGKKGLRVAVASCQTSAICAVSVFTSQFIVSPDPQSDQKGYITWLLSTIARIKPRLLLPVTNQTLDIVLSLSQDQLSGVFLPFSDKATIDLLNNKEEILSLAKQAGMPVPTGILIAPVGCRSPDLSATIQRCKYPAVIKPQFSDYNLAGVYHKLSVQYVSSAEEAEAVIDKELYREMPLVLQERITGEGYGLFLLRWDGRVVTKFAHHRLLERPPSGGVSVLSQSVDCALLPLMQSNVLLDMLGVEGACMLEFKRNVVDNQFYLIEINPRLWGSLQLAIDCGVDFPWELWELACVQDEQPNRRPANAYVVGRRLRWECGTLDHLLMRLRYDGWNGFKDVFFRNSLCLGVKWRSTIWEVFRANDYRPLFREVVNWCKALV